MNVKNIFVEIRTLDESLRDFADTYKKLAAGKRVPKKELLSFESVDVLRKFLTPKRLELLKLIRQEKPNSIYQLAKLAKRDVKSVSTDVNVLADIGMIDRTKSKAKRETITPRVNFDKIRVEIAI